MAESRIKDGNFIVIQSFMVKDLKLKGNELIVYAIIYGFSQDGENRFTGSLQYICDWTNSSKQGIMKSLKSLVKKGLIEKTEIYKNGVKFVEYHITEFTSMQQSLTGYETELTEGMQQSLTGGMQQSLPNNISSNNIIDNIKNIIEYLNLQLGTSYRHTTAKTQTLIKARLAEGFILEDFKTVIDKKIKAWNGTEWEKYLRPETLFGTKFESYLNEKEQGKKPAQQSGNTIDDMQYFYDKYKAEEEQCR